MRGLTSLHIPGEGQTGRDSLCLMAAQIDTVHFPPALRASCTGVAARRSGRRDSVAPSLDPAAYHGKRMEGYR